MKHVCLFFLLATVKAMQDSCDSATVPSECELSVSLMQSDLRLTKARTESSVEPILPDSEDDAVSYKDASLMQMGTHLNSEPSASKATPASKAQVLPSVAVKIQEKKAMPNSASSVAVDATGAVGASDISPSSLSSKQAPSMLEESHKATVTARSLAWLDQKFKVAHTSDASLAIWVFVLGALAIAIVAFCVSGSRNADLSKNQSPLRAPGAGFPTPNVSQAAMSAYAAPSRPATVQSLPNRSPQPSIDQQRLPQSAKVLSGGVGDPRLQVPPTRQDVGTDNELPPICPSLILPHTEARFMIQMDSLLSLSSGPINILGTSGRKLLHAMVCDSPDGRKCLMLASCGCEDDPRTCIFASQQQSAPGAPAEALEVFGKAGKFYGWLEFPGGSKIVLYHSGAGGERKAVLQIDMGNQSDLRMSALTMDGRPLASAGKNAAVVGATGSDTWKMQVKPGTDAVLITSCMLALILLRPWPTMDARYSMGGASLGAGSAMSLRPHTSPAPASAYSSMVFR